MVCTCLLTRLHCFALAVFHAIRCSCCSHSMTGSSAQSDAQQGICSWCKARNVWDEWRNTRTSGTIARIASAGSQVRPQPCICLPIRTWMLVDTDLFPIASLVINKSVGLADKCKTDWATEQSVGKIYWKSEKITWDEHLDTTKKNPTYLHA